jgi:hypothetical protein
MIVQLISSGEDRPIYIELADSKDYRLLTKGRFHFDRSVYKHESVAHVLRLGRKPGAQKRPASTDTGPIFQK